VFVALLVHVPRPYCAGRRLPRFHVCTTRGSQGDFFGSNGDVVVGFSYDQRLKTKGSLAKPSSLAVAARYENEPSKNCTEFCSASANVAPACMASQR